MEQFTGPVKSNIIISHNEGIEEAARIIEKYLTKVKRNYYENEEGILEAILEDIIREVREQKV